MFGWQVLGDKALGVRDGCLSAHAVGKMLGDSWRSAGECKWARSDRDRQEVLLILYPTRLNQHMPIPKRSHGSFSDVQTTKLQVAPPRLFPLTRGPSARSIKT